MRGLRIASAVVAGAAALAGAWIVGGNAYAARREAAAERVFEATFGSRAALQAKYAVAGSNGEARRVEELAKALGSDVSLGTRESWKRARDGFSEKERAAIGDYPREQLTRPDRSTAPASPELAAVLEKRRSSLTTFEEFLVSSPPPRWAFDAREDRDARREPNGLGHMRVQRLLVADALAASAREDSAGAVRALEASWKLNEGLVLRPEILSQLIATAVARLEAGVLRKIAAAPETWTPRLAAMGSRALLVDALVLDQPSASEMAERYLRLRPKGVGWWAHNLVSLLEEPRGRLGFADYGESWARAIAGLRDEPAFRESAPGPKPGRRFSDIMFVDRDPEPPQLLRPRRPPRARRGADGEDSESEGSAPRARGLAAAIGGNRKQPVPWTLVELLRRRRRDVDRPRRTTPEAAFTVRPADVVFVARPGPLESSRADRRRDVGRGRFLRRRASPEARGGGARRPLDAPVGPRP